MYGQASVFLRRYRAVQGVIMGFLRYVAILSSHGFVVAILIRSTTLRGVNDTINVEVAFRLDGIQSEKYLGNLGHGTEASNILQHRKR